MKICPKCGKKDNPADSTNCSECSSPMISEEKAIALNKDTYIPWHKRFVNLNPWAIALVAFLGPGIGQLLLGQMSKGLAILTLGLISGSLSAGLGYIVFSIYFAIDSFILARKSNAGEPIGEVQFYWQSNKPILHNCNQCQAAVPAYWKLCLNCGNSLLIEKDGTSDINKPRPWYKRHNKLNPYFAAFVSLILPGAGQLCIGQVIKGLLLFIAAGLLMILTLPLFGAGAVFVNLFSAIDAFIVTRKRNEGYPLREMEFFYQDK